MLYGEDFGSIEHGGNDTYLVGREKRVKFANRFI